MDEITNMKVFLTTESPEYLNILENAKRVDSIKNADLVLFTGGADVNPLLYNESVHPSTISHNKRDFYETFVYNEARKLNKPLLGICRGGQFLTVMSGGKLIQDASNHEGIVHELKTIDNDKHIMMTSSHHQMMMPFWLNEDEDYQLIAWTEPKSEKYWFNRTMIMTNMEIDPEIIYYPKINALCIQGHPERCLQYPLTMKYVRKLIKQYLYEQRVSTTVLQ